MKLFILAALVACASAASVPNTVSVVRSISQSEPDGTFQYSYELDNGITSNAEGKLKVLGQDEVALEVAGSNSYISPEGEKIETTYIADENGYHPQGSHLPVAPEPLPIPDYIVRAIEYIKAHPAPVEKKL
ncbi:larval cuticle protein LCP-17-like [Zerene cesonia]|uniref:larval cuticle protein LCP-17-like n=1 Tax=Zerene cesonia TaxID=33412 RepID=UPI0018E56A48|nr:larval cuticle protein LCP-17-like [Zerene cesonia]